MKVIDKAWEENLKCIEDCQYKTKEELIKDCCPEYNSFKGIDLKIPKYCSDEYDKEICTKCWNREIEEDQIIENASNKLTF